MHFLVFLLIFTNLLLTVLRYSFDPFINETTKVLLFATQIVINVIGIFYYVYYLISQEISSAATIGYQAMPGPLQGSTPASPEFSSEPVSGTVDPMNLLQSLIEQAGKAKGKNTSDLLTNVISNVVKQNPELLSTVASSLMA